MRKDELRAFLEARNVPLEQWGKGEAKTLEQLFSEISSGEAELKEEGEKIVRFVKGSVINVYHFDGKATWVLQEKKQVFADGRARERNLVGIGEKMKSGESPKECAHRGLKEELGIKEKLSLVSSRPPLRTRGPVPSRSFPGLWSLYVMHVFDVFLPSRLYRPEGYQEKQKDKTSYFVWTKVPDLKA